MNKIIKEDSLRTLARSRYYQILYNRGKEIGTIQLFDNVKDLSRIQIVFLQLLEMYSSLYTDLAMNEDLISEEVVKDWIRADSYLLYKRKEREKSKVDKKTNTNTKVTDRILFRPKRSKRR